MSATVSFPRDVSTCRLHVSRGSAGESIRALWSVRFEDYSTASLAGDLCHACGALTGLVLFICSCFRAGESIRALWSVRFEDYSTASLAVFLPFYFISAIWTAGLAIPSGSFSPTILTGAVAGRLFAHCLQLSGLVLRPDAPLYALVGSAAFFTGAMLSFLSLHAFSLCAEHRRLRHSFRCPQPRRLRVIDRLPGGFFPFRAACQFLCSCLR